MKKAVKRILLTLISLTFVVNTFTLAIHVSAAEEQLAESRISNVLLDIMESDETESITVIIWLKSITNENAVIHSSEQVLETASTLYSPRELCLIPKSTTELFDKYMSERKEALRNAFQSYTQNFANSYFNEEELVYSSKYTATIVARLSESRIIQIASISDVSFIDFYNDSLSEESLTSSAGSTIGTEVDGNIYYTVDELKQALGINSLSLYLNNHGEGVKIGVIELEGTYDFFDDYFGTNITNMYPELNYRRHAQLVMEILYGIAPNADYYFVNYMDSEFNHNDTLVGVLDWLVEQDVDIVSSSVRLETCLASEHRDHDDLCEYGSVAKLLDAYSFTYMITIFKSAGNHGEDGVTSGGMSYNAITVGNYNYGDHIIDIFEDASDPSASSYYSGNTLAYKPDICAPGFIWSQTIGDHYEGTSFATPFVAGVAALICSYYSHRLSPSKIKAILCASTDEKRYEIGTENYKIYGTGVIDGWNIKRIISGDNIEFYWMDSTETSRTYSIILNNPDYQCADIVLAFEKYMIDGGIECGLANLDIRLYDFDEELIASSTTANNNIEILRDIPYHDEPYTLVITQVSPASYIDENENTQYVETYFSISWCEKE